MTAIFTRDPITGTQTPATLEQVAQILNVFDHHDVDPDDDAMVAKITTICLDCYSIAEAPTNADRNATVRDFDLTCCSTVDTIYLYGTSE